MNRELRRIAVVLGALLIGGTPALAGDTSPFTFQVPDGWTEITADTQDSAAKHVPPAMAEAARNTKCAWMAADLSRVNDGFVPNMNVILTDGSGRVTDSVLAEVATQYLKSLGATELSRKVTTFGGVDVGRLAVERAESGMKIRHVVYIMPGHRKTAILTCTVAADELDKYESTFDAVARATKGLENGPGAFEGVGRAAGIGAVAAVVLGLAKLAGKKK